MVSGSDLKNDKYDHYYRALYLEYAKSTDNSKPRAENKGEANRLLKLAAELGLVEARHKCFMQLQLDKTQEISYLQHAASAGNAAAQFQVGLNNYKIPKADQKADNTKQKNCDASYWITESANRGYGPAQFTLGAKFEGEGNVSIALEWYERAAAQGIGDNQAEKQMLKILLEQPKLENKGRFRKLCKEENNPEAAERFFAKLSAKKNKFSTLKMKQVKVEKKGDKKNQDSVSSFFSNITTDISRSFIISKGKKKEGEDSEEEMDLSKPVLSKNIFRTMLGM